MEIDKVDYPSCFGKDGMIGGGTAAVDIEKGECFIAVSEKCSISRKSIFKSELRPLFEKHPEIFDKHTESDNALVLYYMYERLKGDKSRWHPFFEVQSIADLPAFWDDEKQLLEFQDKIFIAQIKKYRV